MSENIVWSVESCSLETFVHSHTLPQLVKVEEGFCSEDDEETLSTGEILMLHSVIKLLVEDADNRQYFVSSSCRCKVEILPRICEDRYYTVKDVVDAWTSADFKFIRVVKVTSCFPSLRLKAGDIFKLNKIVEHNRTKFLECVLNDRTEYLVKIPLDVTAVFEPLARKESYPFQEVLDSFEFPVRVKFKSNCKTQDSNNNLSRGSVLLKNIRRESKIIATSRDDDMNPVLMIPTDLDVCVFPARRAILGDKEYARFCKAMHDSTVSKVDLFENGSRLCTCFEDLAKPTNPEQASSLGEMPIRSDGHVLTRTSNENPSNSIDEQAPPRPLRVESLPHLHATDSDKDDDHHYYDEISSTVRNSDFSLSLERCHKDNDNERLPMRQKDKLGQSKSSKTNSLPPILSGHLQCETNDVAVSPRPHPTSHLSEASSDVSSSADAAFSSQTSSTQDGLSPGQSFFPTQSRVFSCSEHTQDQPAENFYVEPVPASSILPSPMSEFSVLSQDLKDLPVEGVEECLTNLHMGQYAETFQRNQIDGQLLMELDLESLTYLGVRNPLHQQKLLKFINGWRPNTS